MAPPKPYGLMLCPNGLGYSADGMVVIAAAWGRIHDGYWVTWWADAREYIQWSGETGADAEPLLQYMGMLHYITGDYMTIKYPDEIPTDRAPIEVTVDPHPMVTLGAGTLEGCFNAIAGASGCWSKRQSTWRCLRRRPRKRRRNASTVSSPQRSPAPT